MSPVDRETQLATIQSQLEARYGRPLTAEEQAGLRSAVEEQLPPDPDPDDLRGYEPIHPTASGRQRKGGGVLGGIVAFAAAAAKLSIGGLKFASIFVAVGAYSLIWGWRFAIGFVALIAIHELGHVFEARRQGLEASWPMFVPFLGAYVRHSVPASAFNAALISLSGPFWGGVGCAALLAVGRSSSSPLLEALAYVGFLLNLVNLLPVGFLDGGQARRAYRTLRAAGDDRATLVTVMHVGLAVLLIAGMVASHVHQTRL
jgi:Zn-dependent protease